MKRNGLLFSILFIFFFVTGCGTETATTNKDPNKNEIVTPASDSSDKYTVMVYMVGSDLESKHSLASIDLQEMMKIGSTGDMNVVVSTGGANKDAWRTVKRHKVKKDDIETLSDVGNLNMGNPDTLKDFIVWAALNYPADHYTLILWDHGGGTIGGFGADENHGGDALNLSEIARALSDAKQISNISFDVIGFDACLMATIEAADTLVPYAGYMVASEELEPGTGWDYATLLYAVASNTGISGSALGKIITDSFAKSLEESSEHSMTTLSVVDLSRITTVVSSLSALSTAIQGKIHSEDINNRNNWIAVSDSRSKAEDYGNDPANGQFYDMVDLKHLASLLHSTGNHQSEANALMSAINDAVTYKFSGKARQNSNGLSIYFPYRMTYDQAYDQVEFSSDYKNMIKSYLSIRNVDSAPPEFSEVNMNGSEISAQVSSIGDVRIEDIYTLLLTTDSEAENLFFLGMFPVGSTDGSGNIVYDWDGSSFAIQSGNSRTFVPFFVIDSEDGNYLLDIPAMLNNELVDILIYIESDSGQYEVIGAWPGIDDYGMAAKNYLTINNGDTIVPLYLSYDMKSDEMYFVEGESLTVGAGGIELVSASLPDGDYFVAFYATDYAGNTGMSDPFQLTVASRLEKRLDRSAYIPDLPVDMINNIVTPAGIANSASRR